jgi:hypothetical protein
LGDRNTHLTIAGLFASRDGMPVMPTDGADQHREILVMDRVVGPAHRDELLFQTLGHLETDGLHFILLSPDKVIRRNETGASHHAWVDS